MLKNYQYWILSVVAALCLLLVILDIAIVRSNQTLRTDVDRRGQYIQQSAQLQVLYQDMVKALADLAVQNKDDQLRDLLRQEGITINANATPPAPAAPVGKERPR